ncbi:MAG TPA: GGDEF domain-containing protein, partial [Candidatus Acidoferrales bacterium]|nr:GGDEF domain-containing protein [Candidatus Acidoferrales bacterium]
MSLRAITQPSPLEGCGTFPAEHTEPRLQQLGRSEWWLWLSAFLVTVLSAAAFVLTAIPSNFGHSEHFYEIRSDQVRWGILSLLLLFNGWLVYRQWTLRRWRAQLSRSDAGREVQTGQISELSSIDTATGLHTRAFIEQQLGREIARAKRQNSSLSLATIHLDEFAEIRKRYGPSATDAVLKELARRLKKACRGSDFAVRLASDDFLLVLPECTLREVKTVLKRLGSLEMVCSGRKVNLVY